ncbi:UNVERIFIED_CONTAM: hypothetical protein Sradi_4375900 [Sesamum radiatum]|uniref:Uncharacterized protein n=1 Tax=Sesamum radiatum TaxID=300843 RepID=A0AAW2NSD9_SESRA
MEKRVAIIGAGISGLLACKYAASRGFNPVVSRRKSRLVGCGITLSSPPGSRTSKISSSSLIFHGRLLCKTCCPLTHSCWSICSHMLVILSCCPT